MLPSPSPSPPHPQPSSPGIGLPASSRRRTTNTWGPSHLPATVSCAKMQQTLADAAAPPIHILEASLVGVCSTNWPAAAS